ncbi:MAG: outer membrane protein transport protein, partial [Gammaproteobacteria bacterium]|nr:outer membrane protein transport protein [Gammaproteobacteria bacterium]
MSSKLFFKKALLVATISAAVATQAQATNGYFSHGSSIAEKGMAGAGVAYSQDALAASNNPAGMVGLGERQDIGGALFAPMRSYSVTGNPSGGGFNIGDGSQSIDSDNEAFLVPQFGQNWMLDSESSIGLSIYGNGGMNTEYKGGFALGGVPGTYGTGTAGVDLAQLFIATTYAKKLDQNTSVGVSAVVVYQTFEATGLDMFGAMGFSSDPANLSNNGKSTSTGLGIRLGVQGELSPGVSFGAAYQPEISMSEFDEYAGLFAGGGEFNIPSNLTVGLAWQISDKRVFVADIQKINYGGVDSISNGITPLTDGSCAPSPGGAGTGDGCLGAAN